MAQLRFRPHHVVQHNFYTRGDGTHAYFFEKQELAALMRQTGFHLEQHLSDKRLIVNRKRQLQMYRHFLQGKYRKPWTAEDLLPGTHHLSYLVPRDALTSNDPLS